MRWWRRNCVSAMPDEKPVAPRMMSEVCMWRCTHTTHTHTCTTHTHTHTHTTTHTTIHSISKYVEENVTNSCLLVAAKPRVNVMCPLIRLHWESLFVFVLFLFLPPPPPPLVTGLPPSLVLLQFPSNRLALTAFLLHSGTSKQFYPV
jgi:hypothetical protein